MGLVPKLKQVTVTTAGTRVPILDSSDGIQQNNIVQCLVQANSGTIYVGDVTVTSTNGIKLLASANDKVELSTSDRNSIDLAKVYLDGAADGAKANVLFFIRV